MKVDPKKELTPSLREEGKGRPNVVEVFTKGGRKVRPPPQFLD